jgi:hypothetical protein
MAQRKASRKKATSKKRAPKPGRKRYRRSEEELISDLERKIEDLRLRQRARELKGDPGFKAAFAADRALIRAEQSCRKAGHAKLANALKAAHIALQPHLNLEEYVAATCEEEME